MNPEESKQLKPGDKLIYIGEFAYIDEDETIATQGREGHHFFWPEEVSLAPSYPPNGTKSAKNTQKYDPYRKFRKGDKVRLVEWQGRPPFDCENYEPETAGQLCIVAEDEDAESVHLLHVWKLENMESEPNDDERDWLAFPLCSIELVTPVEELAPYFAQELLRGWAVYKDTQNDECEICIYWNEKHPNAKAAAEAECDRLNAEYRKEQSNDTQSN